MNEDTEEQFLADLKTLLWKYNVRINYLRGNDFDDTPHEKISFSNSTTGEVILCLNDLSTDYTDL